MELADLLVSYKQIEGPKDTRKISLPSSTRYSRMLDYLESRDSTKKKKEEESETEESQGFVGWDYGTPRSSSETTSYVNPYYSNNNQWVQDMTAAYKRLGLSDNAIKNLIAKNALESGWGKSTQGSYNFGNITTGSNWKGSYVQGRDKDANGNNISQKFRSYSSIDDYVKDEIQFLTSLYDFNQDDDFDTFIGKLQGNNSGKRRYAEDKQYSTKVKQVYNSI